MDRKKENKRKRIQASGYRKALLELLGGECVRCGFSDRRTLQVDHINGGGLKATKKLVGMKNVAIMREILGGSQEYQLLCANCNWIKRYEKNETSNKFTKKS